MDRSSQIVNDRRLRFVGIAVVAVCVVWLTIALVTARGGRTIFGPILGGDFATFYVAGQTPAAELYDGTVHDRRVHELVPALEQETALPFAYPPFIAALFRPFAWLSYRSAYLTWLLVTGVLYVGGVIWLARQWPGWVGWLAVAFEPFIVECWIGGQLSVLGFAAAVLAFSCRQPFPAGLALGLWWYKPTLLLLALPVFLVARQWRMLMGIIVTGILLAVVSWLAVGTAGCLAYGQVLHDYWHATTATPMVFRVWKFIDLRSFLCQWWSGPIRVEWLAIAVLALACVLRDWRRSDWAILLTGTLIINLYVGIYDAVLVVPALLLMGEATSKWLLALVWLAPWVVGIQVVTPVLATLLIYQLVQRRR